MNVRAIKTAESQNAVNKIKMMTKREVIDVSTEVPKELVELREYMQSNKFKYNNNNRSFLNIAEDMMVYRDKIKEEPTFRTIAEKGYATLKNALRIISKCIVSV